MQKKIKELFYRVENLLLSPVKRTIYVPEKIAGTELLKSNYSALAEYSMLNAPNVIYYASDKISQWNSCMTKDLMDSQSQVAVEMLNILWRKMDGRRD